MNQVRYQNLITDQKIVGAIKDENIEAAYNDYLTQRDLPVVHDSATGRGLLTHKKMSKEILVF